MEETFDVRQIMQVIVKGKWIIALCMILGLLTAGVLSWFVIEEQYESKAIVQVASGVQDTGIMSSYIATEFTPVIFMQRIKNDAVMQQAFETAGYSKFLKGNLNLVNQPNTNLVEIIYKASTAEEAQKHLQLLLNETKFQMNTSVKETLVQLEQTYLNESESLSDEIEKLMTRYNEIIISNDLPEILILQTIASSQFVLTLTEQQTAALSNITGALQNELLQLKVQIDTKSSEYENVLAKYQSVKTGMDSFKPDPFIRLINTPTVNDTPISPDKILNIVIGLLLGLVVGIGLVFFRLYYKTSSSK